MANRMTQNQTPESMAGMGAGDPEAEARTFWRALTLSDFSGARDILRKVTPITPGAFVFPEADDDGVSGDETKGASNAVLLSPLYITMKSTASQIGLFYVEADQYCLAPISKRRGSVYKLFGNKSVGPGACSTASHVKQRDPRFKVGQSALGISIPNAKKTDRAAVFSEVLAQPLPSFLRPGGAAKADERFIELMGARAPYGVWLAMLVHFPSSAAFQSFAASQEASVGTGAPDSLTVDTSEAGTKPGVLVRSEVRSSSALEPSMAPELRAEMEVMVAGLRAEMLQGLAEIRSAQEEQAEGLSDGSLGLASLQQELADLRLAQQQRYTVGKSHRVSRSFHINIRA